MTTITTDGKYLLADKLTTIPKSTKDRGALGFINEIKYDTSIKIVLPNDLVWYKGKDKIKVKATAFSGRLNRDKPHPCTMVAMFKCVNDYVRSVQTGAVNAFKGRMLCLLETGNVLEIALANYHESPSEYVAGSFTHIGSGSCSITSYVETLVESKAITLREAFHYACVLDENSNYNSYSVYGLEEDRLYGTVNVSKEEIEAAFNKVKQYVAEWTVKRLVSGNFKV